jgi:two-component system, sensor histidine kinase and response regulator
MFDLSWFRLQDMTACCAALRRLGTGASSIEAAAERITRYLYTNLTTGRDEDPACVLVRPFKTHPYHRFSPELQTLVDTHLGRKPADPGMKSLTLLGNTGVVSGWNDPARSSRFRLNPLAGPEALAKPPMFSQLFAQFHAAYGTLFRTTLNFPRLN